MASACPPATKALFDKYDTNHDGKITVNELQAAANDCPEFKKTGITAERINVLLAKYDNTKDHQLSCQEFCQMMAQEHCCEANQAKCCGKDEASKAACVSHKDNHGCCATETSIKTGCCAKSASKPACCPK